MQFEARVDPSLRGGIDALRAGDVPPGRDPDTLARIRGIAIGTLAETPGLGATLPDGIASIRDMFVPRAPGEADLMIRIYQPVTVAPTRPCVLYIHGGGMIRGSVAREQAGAVRLARETGAVVASVEYRLAPEHPFPAGIEDCFRALTWLHAQADTLGIDRRRVAVCGGSAGGGLAASVALMARDRRGPAICLQILSSPMLDDRTTLADLPEFEGIPGWSAEMNRFGWDCLLPGAAGSDGVSHYAAPSRAPDLQGLPPAFVSLGDLEIFRDEGLAYATRLAKAGVPVELHLYPGAYHGWEPLNPTADVSRFTAMARERAARRALHEPLA